MKHTIAALTLAATLASGPALAGSVGHTTFTHSVAVTHSTGCCRTVGFHGTAAGWHGGHFTGWSGGRYYGWHNGGYGYGYWYNGAWVWVALAAATGAALAPP
jgi:hypothetical protein